MQMTMGNPYVFQLCQALLQGEKELEAAMHHFADAFEGPFTAQPGETLLRYGDKRPLTFCIQSGWGFAQSMLPSGTLRNFELIIPNSILANEDVLFYGRPMRAALVAKTEIVYYTLDHPKYLASLEDVHAWNQLFNRICSGLIPIRKQRILDLKVMNKPELLARLLQRFPDVFTYCTQEEIASYLNVSRSTLSRMLRKN